MSGEFGSTFGGKDQTAVVGGDNPLSRGCPISAPLAVTSG